nr:unnamed protein product [Naegleria fowleri]
MTTTTSISRYNNYRFNLRTIIYLSDRIKIRQLLFDAILSVIFSETPSEQLQTLISHLLEHEILKDEEMQIHMLEWFSNRDNNTIHQIFNCLSSIQQALSDVKSTSMLISSHSFKTKIMERYSNIFFSEEEILLKRIDSLNDDIEVILPLLEGKSIQELVSLLDCSMRHAGEELSNGTLYCATFLIQSLFNNPNISVNELEELLQKIRLQLMVFVGYCVKEYCEWYREILPSAIIPKMPLQKVIRKDAIYSLFSIVNTLPVLFFETSVCSNPSSDISMHSLPPTIVVLLSKLYLFTKVLEYEGCGEVVKDFSEKILKLIDYSNTEYMNNHLTVDDIKELFSGALHIAYCISIDQENPVKTPATKEQRDLIKAIASLFLKEEGLDVPIAIVEFINYLSYTIHKSSENTTEPKIASEYIMYLIPRLAVIRERSKLVLFESTEQGLFKAEVPQSLYFLCGAIIESHAHHFSSTITQDTDNKKTLCFLFMDECLKIVVYYYSKAIPLFEKLMTEPNITNLSHYDLLYLKASRLTMSFFCPFTLKLPLTRKVEVLTEFVAKKIPNSERINPNDEIALQRLESPSLLTLFYHCLNLRNFFFIISYETSTVGIKLLAGMEKMNNMAVDFSNYLNSFISVASEHASTSSRTNKIDISISVSLCKVIFGIFEQYIQAKDKKILSKFENWPKFVDTTLQLFDPSLVSVLISSLRKVYYEIVDIDSVVWHLLEKLSQSDSSHPYFHFLEVLEKSNEEGVNFMTKYNSVIILERAFKNTTPLLLAQPRSDIIDTILNFCKNHRVLYRLLGLVNVKAIADDLKEESLMNYFSYYESLLGTLYPLLSMIPMNEEYAMEFVSRSQLPKCLIVFLQNNQKHIIKKHPKLLACIFKIYEKSLQIFVTFAKLHPTNQKMEETRNDLFSKTFVFIVKFCFERIQPANQQTFFWSRPDDEEREVPCSFVNILKAITDAATNMAVPIVSTLFKDYLQTLKEKNVTTILQNVELPTATYQQKVKSIISKLTDSNKVSTILPQVSSALNSGSSTTPHKAIYSKFPSFAKPPNITSTNSTNTHSVPNSSSPNNAVKQKQVVVTTPSATSLTNVQQVSSSNNSGTTPPANASNKPVFVPPRQVFRPPPRKQ